MNSDDVGAKDSCDKICVVLLLVDGEESTAVANCQ
jgi:hypothetical protein